MGLIKFNDRSTFPSFSNMLDDFFNQSFSDMVGPKFQSNVPAVNVKDLEKEFQLEVALPGVPKDKVNVQVENDVLTISSEVKRESEEKQDGYTRREFGYNSFSRSFTLPEVADKEKIDAEFKDGVLSIHIPKMGDKALKNSRTISIA